MNASSLINKLQKLYLYVFHVEKTLEHNADQDQGNIEQVEQHDENPVLACTGAVAYSSSYYGQGNGPILLDNVQCTGNDCLVVHMILILVIVHILKMLDIEKDLTVCGYIMITRYDVFGRLLKAFYMNASNLLLEL